MVIFHSMKIGTKRLGMGCCGHFVPLGYAIVSASILCYQWGTYEPTASSKSMYLLQGAGALGHVIHVRVWKIYWGACHELAM